MINFLKMPGRLIAAINILLSACLINSCAPVDLYERTVAIPKHEWQSSFKPSFDFEITDTSSFYQVFFILRHNDKYNFNNIYINLYTKHQSQDSATKFTVDLPLANNEQGWLGTGMDDIYEHRIRLGNAQTFRAGKYTFTLEQIMREDPLRNIMNAGIRLEKVKMK